MSRIPDRHHDWLALYDLGYTVREIGETYAVSNQAVSKALRNLGKPPDRRRTRPNYAPVHDRQAQYAADARAAAAGEGVSVAAWVSDI